MLFLMLIVISHQGIYELNIIILFVSYDYGSIYYSNFANMLQYIQLAIIYHNFSICNIFLF